MCESEWSGCCGLDAMQMARKPHFRILTNQPAAEKQSSPLHKWYIAWRRGKHGT